MKELNGIINVFKPPGPTSSNIVVEARRLLGVKKIGHLGTLDPGAAGVLPLCIGSATRLFDLLSDKRKTYVAEIVFGAATDTQDAFGAVTLRNDMVVSREMLESVLERFTGEIEQIPSAYSALKVGGRRMYELARAGESVPIRPRRVEIHELRALEQLYENRFLISVTCSRGTYVRTLIYDIGLALETAAHMGLLIRTVNGMFAIENAYTLGEIKALTDVGRLAEKVVQSDDALSFLPAVRAPRERMRRFLDGLSTNAHTLDFERPLGEGEPCRLYCGDEFLGVGALKDGEFKLSVRLWENNK